MATPAMAPRIKPIVKLLPLSLSPILVILLFISEPADQADGLLETLDERSHLGQGLGDLFFPGRGDFFHCPGGRFDGFEYRLDAPIKQPRHPRQDDDARRGSQAEDTQ